MWTTPRAREPAFGRGGERCVALAHRHNGAVMDFARARVARRVRLGMVLAVLAGLVAMHGLSTDHRPILAAAPPPAETVPAASDHLPGLQPVSHAAPAADPAGMPAMIGSRAAAPGAEPGYASQVCPDCADHAACVAVLRVAGAVPAPAPVVGFSGTDPTAVRPPHAGPPLTGSLSLPQLCISRT
jgi:hypothetical protein